MRADGGGQSRFGDWLYFDAPARQTLYLVRRFECECAVRLAVGCEQLSDLSAQVEFEHEVLADSIPPGVAFGGRNEASVSLPLSLGWHETCERGHAGGRNGRGH